MIICIKYIGPNNKCYSINYAIIDSVIFLHWNWVFSKQAILCKVIFKELLVLHVVFIKILLKLIYYKLKKLTKYIKFNKKYIKLFFYLNYLNTSLLHKIIFLYQIYSEKPSLKHL